MAIYRILQNAPFGPTEIERITTAYENALRALGLISRDDPVNEVVAKKVIEVAQTGERDPVAICDRALSELGVSPRDT